MFGVSTKGGGQSQAMPDVCKTPAPPAPSPIPIPYPNMAMLNQAMMESKKVKISNTLFPLQDDPHSLSRGTQ